MRLHPHNQDVYLNQTVHVDLMWLKSMLATWGGVRLLELPVGEAEIWTDAATTKGIGGHLGPQGSCSAAFAETMVMNMKEKQDIMYLEAWAL